jgi:hypothetical protein
MEPWHFNLYQSALSALPGVLVVSVLSFLGIEVADKLTFADPFDAQVNVYYEKFLSYLQPLVIPLALGVTCFGAAWASFEKGDRSRENMARARRAYLYYDGAYGLWTQAIMALFVTIYYIPLREKPAFIMLVSIFGFLALAAGMWQRTIDGWKIPKALFVINGYNYEYPKWWFWFRSDAVSRGWRRYRLVGLFFVGLALYLLVMLIIAGAYLAAYGAAYTRVFFRQMLVS